MAEETNEKVLQLIEKAKATGRIRKGTNEVTKAIEKGNAKLVALANDVNPPEIIMHIPILSKEKEVPCFTVGSREELGTAAGLGVPTVAVAVMDAGDAKDILDELSK